MKRRSQRRRSRPDLRGQAGFSLIEVLIAVAVSGLLVAAIAAAMFTLIKVTTRSAKRQSVTAALGSFAESIKGLDYIDCGDLNHGYSYGSSPEALDAGTLGVDSLEIVSIRYWVNPTGAGEGNFLTKEQSGCAPSAPVVLPASQDAPGGPGGGGAPAADPHGGVQDGATGDQGAQLFTIEVRLDDIVQRSTVAKRRP